MKTFIRDMYNNGIKIKFNLFELAAAVVTFWVITLIFSVNYNTFGVLAGLAAYLVVYTYTDKNSVWTR